MISRVATAVAVVFAVTAAATAGPLPVWAYRVTPGPQLIHPNYDGESFLTNPGTGPGNQGWLDFHTTSGSGLRGAQVIRLAGLGTREYVTTRDAGTWIGFNDPYSLTLSLQDGTTGQVGSVSISGRVGGDFTADTMALTSVFLGPASQELTLGDTRYVVSVAKFVAPNGR